MSKMRTDFFEMEKLLLEEVDYDNTRLLDEQATEEHPSEEADEMSLVEKESNTLTDFEDEVKMREILLGQGFHPEYRVGGSLTPQLVDAYIKRVLGGDPYYYVYMREPKKQRYFFKRVELDHPFIYRAYVSFGDRGKEFNWDISILEAVTMIPIEQFHLKIENYRENPDLIQLVKEFREQGHLPFYIVEIPEDMNYTIYRTTGCEWLIRT